MSGCVHLLVHRPGRAGSPLRSAAYLGTDGVCELMLRDVSYSNATALNCDVYCDIQLHVRRCVGLRDVWDVDGANVPMCGFCLCT